MNETERTTCRRCGAPLSAGVPGGLCAPCLGGDLFSDEPSPLPFTHIGDYELLEEIGRGGMGLVYRARQVSVNRAAAVKLILTGPLASVTERRRFVAEAEAAAALAHPGLVAVYEAGEEDGQPFFAMQLVEGESLSTRLQTGPRYAPRAAAELIRHTALAVQHAHERGFLHRDLKPGNILLDDAGAPHVADFGLARRVDDESKLTLTGAAVGTPSYMAPEQTETRYPPTTAVDVYSLGAILYELLAGHPPFAEKSLADQLVAIRVKEVALISTVRKEVDRDLDTICRKCLEKDPVQRYPTAQGLADDLRRWLDGEPITARAVGKPERFWRWCRRRPAIAGLAAAAAVFFLAGLTGIVWQWRRADREAGTALAALNRAEEALWHANLSEARALRISRARGQRTRSLEAVAKAAAYRPTLELRNEAIAALALPDLGEPVFFPSLPAGASDLMADAGLHRAAYRMGNHVVMQQLEETKPLAVFSGSEIRQFLATPDFQRVLTLWGYDGTNGLCKATLWNMADRSRVREFAATAPGVAFSPDGQQLVLVMDGNLTVLSAADGKTLGSAPCSLLPGPLAVAPDGQRAAIYQGGSGELWSLSPPALIRKLPSFPSGVFNVQWHPDGRTFVCGCDNEAFSVQPDLGTARAMTKHDREGVVVTMHPSGQFTATTSWDGILRFSSPVLTSPLLQTSGLRPLQFSADGRSLLVMAGESAGACPVTVPDVWRCLPQRGDENEITRSLDMSPDGKRLAVVTARSLALWDLRTLQMLCTLPLQNGMRGVFTGPDTILLAEADRGLRSVRIVEEAAGNPALQAGPAAPGTAGKGGPFVLSPDGSRVLVDGRSFAVLDVHSGAELFRLSSGPLADNPAWSPDGRWLATGYWNNRTSAGSDACVWSAADGSLVQKLPAGNCAPFFTPDGRRLLISATHECVEYETGTWRVLRRHAREASGLDHGAVAFAPDAGLMALMADESTVRLLSLHTGEELARLTQPFPHKISTAGLILSRDGQCLACEAANSVRIWDLHLLRQKLRPLGLDWTDQPPSR